MRRRTAKLVVGGCGCLVALVLVLGIASWSAVQKQYYLWRLRAEPEILAELLASFRAWDRETPEKQALQAFVRSDRGRESVVRLFVETAIASAAQGMGDPGERPSAGILGLYPRQRKGPPTWYEIWSSTGRREEADFFWSLPVPGAYWGTSGPLGGIARLLSAVEGHDVRLARYPWLVCRVERLEEGLRRYGARRVREIPADAGEYVCVFWEDSSDAAGDR